MSEDNFFGIDKQIDDTKFWGKEIMGGTSITPEVIDQAFKLMMDAHSRPYCQDSKGGFHHWPYGPISGVTVCRLCGWTL